jgi:hypothetical protein
MFEDLGLSFGSLFVRAVPVRNRPGHYRRLTDQRPGRLRHVGEVVLGINGGGNRLDPFRRVQPPLALLVEGLGRLADPLM